MRKIALVARREYAEHVRTKGFWIGLLAFPLILALSVGVPILLSETKQARTYAVIDHSGFVLQEVEKGILAEDLGIVLRDAAERYRDGGQAWERLPDAVRAAAKVYVSLDEAERPTLVQDIAAGEDEVATDLVEWWQQVSAEKLEALGLELSRSRYVRVEVGDDPPAALNRMVNDGALFTPFVMMNRAAGSLPLWEYLATTVLLLLSIYFAVQGAGKVFRIGILMTGKPPRVGEVMRWLTAKEDISPAEREAD